MCHKVRIFLYKKCATDLATFFRYYRANDCLLSVQIKLHVSIFIARNPLLGVRPRKTGTFCGDLCCALRLFVIQYFGTKNIHKKYTYGCIFLYKKMRDRLGNIFSFLPRKQFYATNSYSRCKLIISFRKIILQYRALAKNA